MSSNQIIVLVCAIYFLTMVATGIFAARRNKKASDFLVAGRGLNTPMTAVTLAAVQIGVGIVLSGATNGYNDGVWPGIYYALGCGGGLIVAGLVTSRKLRAQEGYVPLDFFAQRYGDSRGVRFWAWLSNVPSLLGIFIAQMLACGSILEGFGIPFKWGVVLTTCVILIYCTIGGMWGVVLTDAIQTAVIMIGVPILAVATLIKYTATGGSVGSSQHRLSRREWARSLSIWCFLFCCRFQYRTTLMPGSSRPRMPRRHREAVSGAELSSSS